MKNLQSMGNYSKSTGVGNTMTPGPWVPRFSPLVAWFGPWVLSWDPWLPKSVPGYLEVVAGLVPEYTLLESLVC